MPVLQVMKDGIVKGALQAIMGTLKPLVAPVSAVTAVLQAHLTGTVTVGPGSVSADQEPQGSDVKNVNPGIFEWKAIACLVMMNV